MGPVLRSVSEKEMEGKSRAGQGEEGQVRSGQSMAGRARAVEGGVMLRC